ncbi:MAG: hypothetical protein ACK4Y9_09700 [Hyphomonas sp.]
MIELVRFAMSGKLEIAATTRVESDVNKDKNDKRRKDILRALKLFPIIPSIGRWNTSKWDSDEWSDDTSERLAEEIKQIIFPGLQTDDRRYGNKINDVDHLVGHALDRRDIFVTDDRTILKNREPLERGLGIVVMNPTDCLSHVEGIELRSQPRKLPSEGINPAYHTTRTEGSVTFNYSNNNHRYVIGEGEFLFETRWSKASDKSIYALSDPASISAIALALGASDIAEIADATAYDFSSRSRTPRLGQIIIWRNVNGLYAATKVIAIKDDSRHDDVDELTFEYRILSGGGSDFRAS